MFYFATLTYQEVPRYVEGKERKGTEQIQKCVIYFMQRTINDDPTTTKYYHKQNTDHCRLQLTGLHREPVEGSVGPLRGPGGLVLLLLLREPLGLHLSRQVSEESVPAPVVVSLHQGSLGLQTPGQNPAVVYYNITTQYIPHHNIPQYISHHNIPHHTTP